MVIWNRNGANRYNGYKDLERGMGNKERGTGNGEWGKGNGEGGTGNGEWEMGMLIGNRNEANRYNGNKDWERGTGTMNGDWECEREW